MGVDNFVDAYKLEVMTKNQAVRLFGKSQADMGRALQMTRAGIGRWPDDLTDAQTERVLGAALRLGKNIPRELIERRAQSER